jgi:hypothetical protein
MRRLPLVLAAAALIACGSARGARALEDGTLIVGLSAFAGQGDFVSPDATYLAAYDHGELGAQIQTWYMLGDEYAFTLSGGAGRAREVNESGGKPNRYYQQSSWNVRIGADRMMDVSRNALLYFGPGIEYWRGDATFTNILGAGKITTPEVTRWSASGRFGAMLVLSESLSLTGQIGFRMGAASASEGSAKSSWYTSGFDAAAGLAFAF